MNRLITLGSFHAGAGCFASLVSFRKDPAGSQNLAVPDLVRAPFYRAEMPADFFLGFEAGMLLKTRESRTKFTNFEGLFRRECKGFCDIRNKLCGFCKVVRQKTTLHLAQGRLHEPAALTILSDRRL